MILSNRTAVFLGFFLASVFLSACIDDKAKLESDVPPQDISVSITPAATTLPTGGTVVFTPTVEGAGTTPAGTGNSAVTWQVDEGASGGTITSQGAYTAPNVAGTFHVTAESQEDDSKTATAIVTVSTTLDATFGQNGHVRTALSRNAVVKALAMQADGKIIAGGFALNGDNNSFALARYQSDGSIDMDFGTSGIVTTALNDSQIRALAIQSDGKIIAGGFAQGGFDIVDNVAINTFVLARYHTDGSLDTSFGSSGIVTHMIDGNSEINALKVLSDGQILVAGSVFNTTNKDDDFVLARFHTDGSLDTSFGTDGTAITDFGGKDDKIAAMALQADGKIVVGGVSLTGGGNDDFALARYQSDGTLDTSFGTLGKTLTDVGGGAADQINALAILLDEKIVAGGFAANGTDSDFALVRYDADGNFLGTTLTDVGTGANDEINALALQVDGKIVAGGFAFIGTANDFSLARYSPSGVLDTSFGVSGVTTTSVGTGSDTISAILLKTGGEILVAGGSSNGALTNFSLVQYDSSGTPDGAFAIAGKATTAVGGGNDEVNAIAVQADDKIVAAGFSVDDFALARYDQSGVLDPSFNVDGKIITDIGEGDRINALGIQADEKIVAGGLTFNGTDDDFALVRYHADGSADTTFGINGNGIVTTSIGPAVAGNNDAINALSIQADGKILAAGIGSVPTGVDDTRTDFALVRYNANGTLDASFDSDGKVTTQVGTGSSFGQASAIQVDGKILIAGHAFNGVDFDFALVRYEVDGALDPGFGTGGIVTTPLVGGGDDIVNGIAIQTDGKIIVGGGSLTGDLTGQFILVRFNSDGTLDNAFGSGGIVTTPIGTLESRVTALKMQADGKILSGGFSFGEQNKRDFALVRYNPDGSLDAAFGVGGIEISPFSAGIDEVRGVGLQSDGKIVAAGTVFDDSGFNADFLLARYAP